MRIFKSDDLIVVAIDSSCIYLLEGGWSTTTNLFDVSIIIEIWIS